MARLCHPALESTVGKTPNLPCIKRRFQEPPLQISKSLSRMSQTTVFVLGATGYIGGAVLVDLKRRHPDFVYTALVRNTKDNAAIEALDVKVVNGSHADLEKIKGWRRTATSSSILPMRTICR